ncbi:redoxin domain-containing protein [candidate division GN15 bacterium]|nr:redoxin domain-containing protein [candidate division GN15 bacterium]
MTGTNSFRWVFALTLSVLALTALLLAAGCGGDQTAEETEDATRIADKPIPSLQDKLDRRKAQFTEEAPAEMVNTFEKGVAQVAESGVLETALGEGDRAPMFALPNAVGDTVRLAGLLETGPAVLVWYRGGWCPYCNMQLNAMQEVLPLIKERGASLVAISPEVPDSSLSTKEMSSLEFHVLSDVGNTVAEQFGIVYTLPPEVQEQFQGRLDIPAYNADESWTLPLAVTYVVDTDGVIRYAFVDPDYRKRAEPSEIIAALDRLRGA